MVVARERARLLAGGGKHASSKRGREQEQPEGAASAARLVAHSAPVVRFVGAREARGARAGWSDGSSSECFTRLAAELSAVGYPRAVQCLGFMGALPHHTLSITNSSSLTVDVLHGGHFNDVANNQVRTLVHRSAPDGHLLGDPCWQRAAHRMSSCPAVE